MQKQLHGGVNLEPRIKSRAKANETTITMGGGRRPPPPILIICSLALVRAHLKKVESSSRNPGKSQDKKKEPQEDFQRLRGVPSSSSKALLGLFSLILAFPWSPGTASNFFKMSVALEDVQPLNGRSVGRSVGFRSQLAIDKSKNEPGWAHKI